MTTVDWPEAMRCRALLPVFLAGILMGCGGGGGGGSASNAGSGNVVSPPEPVDDVVLTFVAPAEPVPAGTTPALEFTITNPSMQLAQDVRLTVSVDAGLSLGDPVECVPTGKAVCPSSPSATRVQFLPAQSSLRFTFYPMVERGMTGNVSVTAAVVAASDDVTSNNSVRFAIETYTDDVSVATAPDVSDVLAGASVPFSITVANAGPDAARNVSIQSLLGGRQTLSAMTCSASGGATCPAVVAPDMEIALLPSGGSLTFDLTTQLATDALASVSASMRIQTAGDANYANNIATVSAYVRAPAPASSPTFAVFESDEHDYIGMGRDYSYTKTNAVFELEDYGADVALKINGNETWRADFSRPASQVRWQPGIYVDSSGAGFDDPESAGLRITSANGCHGKGWFRIIDVAYSDDAITAFDVIFAQHCDDSASALRGRIHWMASDGTGPTGPVNPPPDGLWAPTAGAVPASGNYVYLTSSVGEPILQGATKTFTQMDSALAVYEGDRYLAFSVAADERYSGSFRPMAPITQMQPGYYAIDPLASTNNPVVSALSVSGNGRECVSAIGGWFAIDSIAYDNEQLIAVDARFEQQCGNQPALHGQIHWRSDDQTQPSAPQVPAPAGLWLPPAGVVPAAGNVIYLEGADGSGIPGGGTLTYTPLDSIIEVGNDGIGPGGNRFHITVAGDESWTGDFQTMNSLADLQPGYYGDVGAYPDQNPVRGGIKWTGESSCYAAHGWFVVDSIVYDGSAVAAIELRFEQYCGVSTVPLHGYIRWSPSDTRVPLPPQNPPPANLWQPAAGTTPLTGNYAYFQREMTGSPSESYSYTQASAEFKVTSQWGALVVEVNGDERWRGAFVPMQPYSELQPGYYDLEHGSSNPAKGSLSWTGQACGSGYGWFVVDEVTYQSGVIRSIALRFETSCLSDGSILRGKIFWRFDDPTAAQEPTSPVPAGLWQPASGTVPATGNVFYAVGELNEFITDGLPDRTILLKPPAALFQGGTGVDDFYVGAQIVNDSSWGIHLKPMNSIPRLQIGYYPNTPAPLLGNPTRGRFDVGGRGRTCGQDSTGWFAVDAVTYQGEEMTSLAVRFEYRCGVGAPALRGQVRWSK